MENITKITSTSTFKDQAQFRKVLQRLRAILNATELKEELENETPIYTLENKKLIALGVNENYLTVLFFDGNLLHDSNNLLLKTPGDQTGNMRQLQYASLAEIDENALKTYIDEAINIQKKIPGTETELPQEPVLPTALQNAFALSAHLKKRFMLLKDENQQEYIEYINGGSDEQARSKRLEHCLPFIMRLRGIADLKDKL